MTPSLGIIISLCVLSVALVLLWTHEVTKRHAYERRVRMIYNVMLTDSMDHYVPIRQRSPRVGANNTYSVGGIQRTFAADGG